MKKLRSLTIIYSKVNDLIMKKCGDELFWIFPHLKELTNYTISIKEQNIWYLNEHLFSIMNGTIKDLDRTKPLKIILDFE
jgi:hypothetical protein